MNTEIKSHIERKARINTKRTWNEEWNVGYDNKEEYQKSETKCEERTQRGLHGINKQGGT